MANAINFNEIVALSFNTDDGIGRATTFCFCY